PGASRFEGFSLMLRPAFTRFRRKSLRYYHHARHHETDCGNGKRFSAFRRDGQALRRRFFLYGPSRRPGPEPRHVPTALEGVAPHHQTDRPPAGAPHPDADLLRRARPVRAGGALLPGPAAPAGAPDLASAVRRGRIRAAA